MTRSSVACLLGMLMLLAPNVPQAEPTPAERQEIEAIIREYLLREPEVLMEALQELQARREVAQQERVGQLLQERRELIFDDPDDPVIGNRTGDVTLVEFFDYRCGYCRSMMPDLRALLEQDGKIRLVMKEFPILGPESIIASKAALAALRQGRYADMHWALMQAKDLSREHVLTLAQQVGLDPQRLAVDMDDPALAREIDANVALAKELGINGTPSFVIGTSLIPGAIPITDLAKLVADARSGERKLN
jgi:protein-disulfide isomerase